MKCAHNYDDIRCLGVWPTTGQLEFECKCGGRALVLQSTLPSFHTHHKDYAKIIVHEAQQAASLALQDSEKEKS